MCGAPYVRYSTGIIGVQCVYSAYVVYQAYVDDSSVYGTNKFLNFGLRVRMACAYAQPLFKYNNIINYYLELRFRIKI